MSLIPAPGFLLIEILTDPKKTKEGIYLPQDIENEPMRGKVVIHGLERMSDAGDKIFPPEFLIKGKVRRIEKDDIIYFKPHTQYEIPSYDERKLALVVFETVMGIELEE